MSPLQTLNSSRAFLSELRHPNSKRVKVVQSSASPSFFEVSRLDSCLKKGGMLLLGRGPCGFLGIGLMDGSSSILKINVCIQKLKVKGDILSPCGLQQPSPKFLEERPFSNSIQAVYFYLLERASPGRQARSRRISTLCLGSCGIKYRRPWPYQLQLPRYLYYSVYSGRLFPRH